MDFDREQAETLVLSAIGMARWAQRSRLQESVHSWSRCLIFNTLTLALEQNAKLVWISPCEPKQGQSKKEEGRHCC